MKYAYLIKVEPGENNNKFYEMTQVDSNNFVAKYGRVGGHTAEVSYSMSRWNRTLSSKLSKRKGYVDVTELHVVETADSIALPTEQRLNDLFSYLITISNTSFKNNYIGSGNAITSLQIEEAQRLLNTMVPFINDSDIDTFNDLLVELLRVIPRHLGNNVKDRLATSIEQAKEIHQRETDNLDNANVQSKLGSNGVLTDNLGIEISAIDVNEDIDKLFGNSVKRIKNVFSVSNTQTQKLFDDFVRLRNNKDSRLLVHGTNEINVLPILEQGLQIRPAAHGRMLGHGIYLSDMPEKSLNYINGKRKFMFVFQTHVGNVLTCDGRNMVKHYSASELDTLGYNCVYVPSGTNTGWRNLTYSEYCVYNVQQVTVKYLLEV